MKMSFLSQGAPDLDKIRKHVLKALGALIPCRALLQRRRGAGSAKSRVFYSAVVGDFSKPVLSNKTYWAVRTET
jgi:hypothetical protein